MSEHTATVENAHMETADHHAAPAEEHAALEQFGEVTSRDDLVSKAATIAVVGVGVALISAELLPGMIIGVAAAFLPGVGKKIRPFLKQTVRAGFTMAKKTREMVSEAGEQVQDMIAEAKAEHAESVDPVPPMPHTEPEPAAHAPAHS
jgi:hypothetical protein